jgi:hypothetical protein
MKNGAERSSPSIVSLLPFGWDFDGAQAQAGSSSIELADSVTSCRLDNLAAAGVRSPELKTSSPASIRRDLLSVGPAGIFADIATVGSSAVGQTSIRRPASGLWSSSGCLAAMQQSSNGLSFCGLTFSTIPT